MEEQDYMLFEDYLSNELSKEEIISFENRLKTDSKFKESLQLYKETSSFLEDKFENEENLAAFKANIEKISKASFNKTNTNQNKKGTKKTINYFLYSLSACVVLLFGIFMFNQFSNPSYSDYANYGTISLTVRGNNNALLQTAENAFNTKDFKKADEALKSLIVSDENNAELKLYRGIANVELSNFEVADALLSNLQKGNSAYKYKATWYLALSKLKQNENDECLQILKTIPEDADDYNQAQKLINKLD